MSLVTEAPATTPAHTDGRRARGDRARRAILARSLQLASAEGLEDLSIARLAGDLGMSKSGLFAHFGSKEELQLSTIRAARRVFSDEAVTPALAARAGVERLRARRHPRPWPRAGGASPAARCGAGGRSTSQGTRPRGGPSGGGRPPSSTPA